MSLGWYSRAGNAKGRRVGRQIEWVMKGKMVGNVWGSGRVNSGWSNAQYGLLMSM
jgi:hypothetical protein